MCLFSYRGLIIQTDYLYGNVEKLACCSSVVKCYSADKLALSSFPLVVIAQAH